jgi:hypothetical protein
LAALALVDNHEQLRGYVDQKFHPLVPHYIQERLDFFEPREQLATRSPQVEEWAVDLAPLSVV